jgi:hypothetical protein
MDTDMVIDTDIDMDLVHVLVCFNIHVHVPFHIHVHVLVYIHVHVYVWILPSLFQDFYMQRITFNAYLLPENFSDNF